MNFVQKSFAFFKKLIDFKILNYYNKSGGMRVEENIIQRTMILYGFNFLLIGTIYIYEMVLEMANNTEFSKGVKLMQYISDKHGVKFKTMNRSVRWAIDNASKR